MTHTPGPWFVHPYVNQQGRHNKAKDVGPYGVATAVVLGPFEQEWDAKAEANARLIAAAPRMYEFVASKASSGDTDALAILEQINGNAKRD